jgi:CRISPR-associated endonuclease Cas1
MEGTSATLYAQPLPSTIWTITLDQETTVKGHTSNRLPSETTNIVPHHGVVTLFGFGIQVSVDRGHLLVNDGIGADRRRFRFPRVGHRLKRLVVIGSDGMISLAALRWITDQNASFVFLERDGSVLATASPKHPSDARLRRAQALAIQSGAALEITRELIAQKLDGQAKVARETLLDTSTAAAISDYRARLATAETTERIRLLESLAGHAYWSAWRNLPINFPKTDICRGRVPDHWRTFNGRISALTGSPRSAVNPANAILNYVYAILEAEARIAVTATGLDVGLGLLHADGPTRASMACDILEPVRPKIDDFVLRWITRETLKRDWFFEQRDGNCRLMASLAARLSETAPTWGRAVAPVAEWVAQSLWTSARKPISSRTFPTRLTQRLRTEGRGKEFVLKSEPAPQPSKVCSGCGATTKRGQHCPNCGREVSGEKLTELAKVGRLVAQSPESQRSRSETQRRHEAAKRAWRCSAKPTWPDEETYFQKIQPRLASVTISVLSSLLGVSESYAADLRAGRRHPHPRHWQALAQLVGVSFGV